MFAGGLWLSGLVGSDTLVTVSEYSTEYGPGPMVGTSPSNPFDPAARSFKVVRWTGNPEDSSHVERTPLELSLDPNADPLVHDSWSEYVAQAAPLGAPLRHYKLPDTSTPDPFDSLDVIGPDVLGDQMIWSVYNDADPSLHSNQSGNTPPLGVQVVQTVYGFAHDDSLANTVFMRFQVINKGGTALNQCFASLWLDPDIGDYVTDLVGCDVGTGLGYAYKASSYDSTYYGNSPPAVGVDFFRSTLNGVTDTQGIRSFIKLLNGTDPVNAVQSYHYQSGLGADGSPIIDPTTGLPTPYFHPGDPVAGTGWRDGTDAHSLWLADYFNVDTTHTLPIEGVSFGGVQFAGGAGTASQFTQITGSSITSLEPFADPDSFTSVVLEFTPPGQGQKAYRFLRYERADGAPPASVPSRGYLYGGFHDVPFVATNAYTGDTLDVVFFERLVTDDFGTPLPAGQQYATLDSTWGPDDSPAGGFEYMLILNRKYTGTPDPLLSPAGGSLPNPIPALYALWAKKITPASQIDPGDVFLFLWNPDITGDKRMLLSSAPYSFVPGDTLDLLSGVVIGQGTDRLAAITSLRHYDDYAQRFVDSGKALQPSTSTSGSFLSQKTAFVAPAPPTAAAAGDFDKDGLLDVAVTSESVDSLWIYYGKGGGAFQDPISFPTGHGVLDVAVADLDGNTYPDIVTANGGDNTISVFYGSAAGFGAFAPTKPGGGPPSLLRTDFGTNSQPRALAIGNVIGGAQPDVVVVCEAEDSLDVFPGGVGGLTPDRADFGTGSAPVGVAVGDVNGDGLLDVAFTNSGDNTMSLLRGVVGGLLETNRTDFGTAASPGPIVLGDLDSDLKDDVVVANLDASSVSIRLGTGTGLSPDRADFGTGSRPTDVALADLNGDGRLDVVTSDQNASSISVLHGRGDGTLADRTTYPSGSFPNALVIGDYNNDGKPDVLSVNTGSSSVSFYSNQDSFVPTLVSWIGTHAEGGRVRVEWYTPQGSGVHATVYRRTESAPWAVVGSVISDASGFLVFTDGDVAPGGRYGYRLSVTGDHGEVIVGESWIDIPNTLSLAFGRMPNPLVGDLSIAFSLPRATPARLEMFDVRGRRVLLRDLPALDAGSHTLRMGAGLPASGIYWLRLTQGNSFTRTRVVWLR